MKYYVPIPQQLDHILLIVYDIYAGFIAIFSYLISGVLFIFYYLYIFVVVVVYKSYKDGQKLKNMNSYIKPIMK